MLINTDMFHVVIAVLYILLLLYALYFIINKNRTLRKLKSNEILFKAVFDQAPIGIAAGLEIF
jgi:heme A synthase